MPVRPKLRNDIKLSLDAIYRLGHCANYGQTDSTEWDVEFVPDNSFEIGVWEAVPVDLSSKRKQKNVNHEPRTEENIDYASHLTPTIENMRQPIEPVSGQKPKEVLSYVNIYKQEKPECFCYVCLTRYNINFPKRMTLVPKKARIPKLFQATNATERSFVKMMRVMTTHRIGRPLGIPIDYGTILEFFEEHCRLEVLDIGILLNDWLLGIMKRKSIGKLRKLHEVFKSLVFASVAKMLYRNLCDYVPEEELRENAFWYIKNIEKFDPLSLLDIDEAESANSEELYIDL